MSNDLKYLGLLLDCWFLFSVLHDHYRLFIVTNAYSSVFVVPRAHLIRWTDGPDRFRARQCHIEWGEQAFNEFSWVADFDSHQNLVKLWPFIAHTILARLQPFNYGSNTELKLFLILCLLLLYDVQKKDYRTFRTKLTVQSVPIGKSLTVDALGLVVPSQWIEPKSDGDSFVFFCVRTCRPNRVRRWIPMCFVRDRSCSYQSWF